MDNITLPQFWVMHNQAYAWEQEVLASNRGEKPQGHVDVTSAMVSRIKDTLGWAG